VVIIFGWGAGKAKDLGEVAPTVCPNCRNEVFLHAVRSDKQFSLYFVPIASYGGDEYLVCPVCQHALEIRPEHKNAVNSMRSATASYRRGRVPDAYYRQTVDQFWGFLGVNPNGQRVLAAPTNVPAPAAAAAPGVGDAGPSLAQQLKSLGELRDQGALTEHEFAAAKKRLLEG
jgi:uncharacterized protein YbaR (Trm112 family)